MKNSELNIGVIVPPDNHYSPVLYSDTKASNEFKKLNNDIYQNQKHYSFEDTKKTPKVIKWTVITALLASGGVLLLNKFRKTNILHFFRIK